MELLWVRWFGTETGHCYGFKVARFPKIGFVNENDDLARPVPRVVRIPPYSCFRQCRNGGLWGHAEQEAQQDHYDDGEVKRQ